MHSRAGDAERVGRLTLDHVPNKPKTPLQSFRCDVELWKAAQEKARSDGTTLGAVLRAYLKRYVSRK